MKKTLVAGLALALSLMAGSAFAEQAYQKDIQLFSQQDIVITNSVVNNGATMTINDAAKDLGALVEVRYVHKVPDDKDSEIIMTHAFYTQGELWMRGEVAPDQVAPVERMVTKRTDVATSKGLAVGDSFEKLIELYGEPQFIHWNRLNQDDSLEVDRWFVYQCQEPYEKGTPKAERPEVTKLLIGIKGLEVTRVGYSGMWRLGL